MELCLIPTVVGKGENGRTACGSAAYRSCEKIIDNEGNVHDYRYKSGHVAGGVELPDGAPEELRDPQTLWQRHEIKDKRRDAELYRDILVTLPNELDYVASMRVSRALAALLTEKGMCVQWDIHDSINAKGERNLHVHMMITMRTLLPDGTFGNKDRSWNHYNGGLNIADLLRPEAARLMNEELALIGSSERVEHESYADRGIDKIPTKHMGVAATAMERKGVKTNKGERNRYIDFLNQIHAENLRQVEAAQKKQHLSFEDQIAEARAQQGGHVVFKEWDALFALVRDTRRCRAALNTELGKLGKVVSAYERGDEGYLRWAGCDPEDGDQKAILQRMQDELRIQIKELDVTEAFLLDSKELLKAHNKVVYTVKKASWDQYQINRSKRGIDYCVSRLEDINDYITSLYRSITLLDIIFRTEEYREFRETLDDLYRQRQELQRQLAQDRAALKKAKEDRKIHKRDAKEAARDERKARRQLDKDR